MNNIIVLGELSDTNYESDGGVVIAVLFMFSVFLMAFLIVLTTKKK